MDEEVRRIVLEARERTLELLRDDRELLQQVAEALLENEVVTRDELRKIMGTPITQPDDDRHPDVGHGGESAAASAVPDRPTP